MKNLLKRGIKKFLGLPSTREQTAKPHKAMDLWLEQLLLPFSGEVLATKQKPPSSSVHTPLLKFSMLPSVTLKAQHL